MIRSSREDIKAAAKAAAAAGTAISATTAGPTKNHCSTGSAPHTAAAKWAANRLMPMPWFPYYADGHQEKSPQLKTYSKPAVTLQPTNLVQQRQQQGHPLFNRPNN